MVKTRVKFYGYLKDLVGASQGEIALVEGATLRDIIAALGRSYGEEIVRRILHPGGSSRGLVQFFLNGEPVDMQALDVPLLKRGDVQAEMSLYVLTSVAGG